MIFFVDTKESSYNKLQGKIKNSKSNNLKNYDIKTTITGQNMCREGTERSGKN